MISLYTDGSSSGKGNKPGGWAWIVVVDDQPYRMGRGGDPSTTNNRMELKAALEGLLFLERSSLDLHSHVVEMVSDSEVTLGIASGAYVASTNQDLAVPLRDLAKTLGIRTRWVKGHSGDHYNTRCDIFAKAEKEKLNVEMRGLASETGVLGE